MFDLVVAVNDEEILEKNLLRSPLIDQPGVRLHVRKGYRSAGEAYTPALRGSKSEWTIFLHQDVFLPEGWDRHLLNAIEYLEDADPNWAILGLYGVTCSGQHVGHLWCSSCNKILGTHLHSPRAVCAIDELLILVKKSSGVAFDPKLPGFHLYGTDIVQTALKSGKGAYVVCAPVIHNAKPLPFLHSSFFEAYRFLSKKWRGKLPLNSVVMTIEDSRLRFMRKRAENLARRLRYRNVDRSTLDRGYDPVALANRLGF